MSLEYLLILIIVNGKWIINSFVKTFLLKLKSDVLRPIYNIAQDLSDA